MMGALLAFKWSNRAHVYTSRDEVLSLLQVGPGRGGAGGAAALAAAMPLPCCCHAAAMLLRAFALRWMQVRAAAVENLRYAYPLPAGGGPQPAHRLRGAQLCGQRWPHRRPAGGRGADAAGGAALQVGHAGSGAIVALLASLHLVIPKV
jgi:hypothetical protein